MAAAVPRHASHQPLSLADGGKEKAAVRWTIRPVEEQARLTGFLSHGGIDLLAIGRAVWNDLCSLSFVEGGSTITQQLAKNMLFTQEKDLCRKAAEVFAAWDLESHYSKDEILELYVNSIYFGSGCYSVGAASQTYFEKDPAQMDANECTLLAGIPNAPSVYDLSVNPELAAQRQRQVVSSMLEHEFLTQEEAEELLAS